jgi:hypothetical protein
MNCKEFKSRIDSAFKGGAFEIADDVKKHTDLCPDCMSYLHNLLELQQVLVHDHLEVTQEELSEISFERIVSLATGETKRTARKNPVFASGKWAWIPAVAAAIVIMVIFIPRFISRPTVDYSTGLILYESAGHDLEKAIASSDSLGAEFLSTLMSNSSDIYQAGAELVRGNNIDEMLNGLSEAELKALDAKLANLKG